MYQYVDKLYNVSL